MGKQPQILGVRREGVPIVFIVTVIDPGVKRWPPVGNLAEHGFSPKFIHRYAQLRNQFTSGLRRRVASSRN